MWNRLCPSKRVFLSWLWHYIHYLYIYISLCTQSADSNPFRGMACNKRRRDTYFLIADQLGGGTREAKTERNTQLWVANCPSWRARYWKWFYGFMKRVCSVYTVYFFTIYSTSAHNHWANAFQETSCTRMVTRTDDLFIKLFTACWEYLLLLLFFLGKERKNLKINYFKNGNTLRWL